MNKLTNILFHPTMIARYLTDRAYKLIIWTLSFFILTASILLAYSFKVKYYDYSFCENVSYAIASKGESNIEYSNNKLTGKTFEIKGSGIYLYFLKSDFAHNDYGLVLNFKEEEVDIYYKIYQKETIKYSDLKASDFTFSDIKYDNGLARINFEGFLNNILDTISYKVSLSTFFSSLGNIIFLFLGVIVVGIIFSMFINPMIKFKHRLVLVIYDSLIFFVFIMAELIFKATWLQYVALLMPMAHIYISFRKIVVLRR